MNAGLPGTGLGGLFYILLALLMPIRELYLTARGRSSRDRWKLVLRQAAIASGIVLALLPFQLLVAKALQVPGIATSSGVFVVAPAVVGVVLLLVLVLAVRVWALLAGGRAP